MGKTNEDKGSFREACSCRPISVATPASGARGCSVGPGERRGAPLQRRHFDLLLGRSGTEKSFLCLLLFNCLHLKIILMPE